MTIGRTGRERGMVPAGILAFLAAALLAACGGGGGGGGGVGALPPADGPGRTPANAFSSGVFLGRGSVIVNGVQFSPNAGAQVFFDDALQPTGELVLEIGMVPKVRGTFGLTTLTGTYDRIDVEPQVIGAVGGSSGNTFTVLGQTVTLDNMTVLKNIPGGTLTDGDVVEVHGLFAGANAILATFIGVPVDPAKQPAGGTVQIRGVVTSINVATSTFSIGSQEVSHALLPLPQGPAVGDFVEVEGTLSAGVIEATKVEVEDVAAEASGRETEMEGFVQAGSVTGTGFVLLTESGPVPVSFGLGTLFKLEERNTPSTQAILSDGAHVEVEGTMGVNGILAAAEIELRREENVVLEGDVQGLIGGTFTLSPFGFTINSAGALVTGGTVANGAHVEVGGNLLPPGTPGSVVVTRVTVLAPGTRFFLQGPVANINVVDNTFSILGIAIDLTGVQERDDPALGLTSEFENAANIRIDRGTFMDRLRSESVVKAKAEPDPLNPPFDAAANTFNPRAGVEIQVHR